MHIMIAQVPSPHVVYIIEVSPKELGVSNSAEAEMNVKASYKIARRFRHFKTLDKGLRGVIPKSQEEILPTLPKGGWRRSFKREYLEKKSRQLQTYLRTSLSFCAPPLNSVRRASFLAVNPADKHPLVQNPRTGARPAADLAPSPPPPTLNKAKKKVGGSVKARKAGSFKTVLLGESGCGKSSIAARFVRDQFEPYLESTIGAAFLSQSLIVEGRRYKFDIWDTAGQERYHSLAPLYYRGAAVAIITYDITKEHTFDQAERWVKELRKNCPDPIVIALVGNKTDLDDMREVTRDEGRDLAQELKVLSMECSAKTGRNVVEIFNEIARHLPEPAEDTMDFGEFGRKNVINLSSRQSGSGDGSCAC